ARRMTSGLRFAAVAGYPKNRLLRFLNHFLEGAVNQRGFKSGSGPYGGRGVIGMAMNLIFGRGARLVAVIGVALMVAACANKPKTGAGADGAFGAGAATPVSSQDFVVNVGDRVFFETDSTELTVVSRTTLDRQAQW